MFVLLWAIGAFIAGVGIGALWIQWITIGALVFIAGAAVASSISAFDLVVSVFMAVLGFVIGGRWRPRTRRRRRRASQSGSDGAAWSSWSSWTDSGSTSSSVESFGGGDSGGAGASAIWSDSSSGGDSGGGDSGGGDSGGGSGGGGSD